MTDEDERTLGSPPVGHEPPPGDREADQSVSQPHANETVPALGGQEETPAPISPAAIERLRAALGKRAAQMLPILIDTFLQDGARLVTEARRAFEQGQVLELRRAAHTLKSSSAMVGAAALSAVARELERLARDETVHETAGLIEVLAGEFARARGTLEAVRREL